LNLKSGINPSRHGPSWTGGVLRDQENAAAATETAQTGWWFGFKNISV